MATFNVVTDTSEIPGGITRRGRGKWGEAVEALDALEIGQALSFSVEDNRELNQVRNGIRDAIKRGNTSMLISTRTVPNPSAEYPEAVTLYIIKVDVIESEDEDDE